ncbi:hypothetical protein NMB33_00205 [Burkholderia sp. FXe9]|nr:hypothetical protein NMB33_18655 [Burkholderia sp. FXe9]UTP22340.1 hypothetical protein NMB33_00205 [Burkholderia sp. FXe9]
MDDTAISSGPPADEPVINVIEPDPPPLPDPQGGAGGAERFDQMAADALAARRRREFDAARSRLRDRAIQADAPSQDAAQHPAPQWATQPRAPRGSGDAPSVQWVPLGNPPETVRKRYLRAGNQYFLKDAPHQLAFEDIGPYLVTEHNRPDVVESMVDMVRAKAWGRIRVAGHEQFRREVWVQATLLGIEVSGYEPKAVDFARLAEGRRERMTNRIDVTETSAATQVPAGSTKTQEVKPGVSASPNGQPVKQPLKPDANPQPAAGAKIPLRRASCRRLRRRVMPRRAKPNPRVRNGSATWVSSSSTVGHPTSTTPHAATRTTSFIAMRLVRTMSSGAWIWNGPFRRRAPSRENG